MSPGTDRKRFLFVVLPLGDSECLLFAEMPLGNVAIAIFIETNRRSVLKSRLEVVL
ncbi:hypothetical protein HPP92_004226 [Vanilla planifolia]|uniref:Uncharacterized protein n=1 Tax=Vanilla planifolia TaxID=51239 RepID=A0A835RHB8_VANPL|nr:hypothetical protein HPP92_004682 [Vanilla planifolia]KAG0493232.1 hypothetical protein HPP92_004226 [Vanilla planifolia]